MKIVEIYLKRGQEVLLDLNDLILNEGDMSSSIKRCLEAINGFSSEDKIENFPKNLGIFTEGFLANRINRSMAIVSKSY